MHYQTISKAVWRLGRGAVVIGGGIGVAILLTLLLVGKGGTNGGAEVEIAETDEESVPVFTPDRLSAIQARVREEVEKGAFAGAAFAMGVGSHEFHLEGLGAIGWTRNAAPVDPVTTMYDLASLTKVVATASAVLLLVDEGKLSLDDPISRFFPEFGEGPKSRVTIRHLLTHTSGIPAGATLLGDTRAQRIARAKSFSIYPPAGARVEYSDVGYIVLWEAAEAAAGEPLPGYLDRKLFGPLGMHATRFSPGLECEACAPTGRLRDQSLYRGRPFDPLAQRLDGISGHSGLFSSAYDLGRFAAMITNGGELDGARILSEASAREFLAHQPVGDRYRLGWQIVCPEMGEEVCDLPLALGHTGWTGTSLYIEPETGLWMVLLTNRTYEPRAPNRIAEIRREMLSIALAAREASPTGRGGMEADGIGGELPGDLSPIAPAQDFPSIDR
jgi:serine-type D-Ala-D-Ala carboxypeptidase